MGGATGRCFFLASNAVQSWEYFDATGGNATKDGNALKRAIAYFNRIGGGTLVGTPGREYHIDKLGGSSPIAITAPLRIDLNGATIKRPDGVMTANFSRMVYLSLGANASLEVTNGTIDANYTNNQKPDGTETYAWQQNTSFHVEIAAGVNASQVKFTNLVLKDREVFDHLRVVPGTGATLDSLHVENVRSETAWDARRADVIWYRGIEDARVENCPYLHGVETEFLSNEDDRLTTVSVLNSSIKRLDLTFEGNAANKSVTISGITAEQVESLEGGQFTVSDCVLSLGGTGTYIRAESLTCTDVEWRIPATGWVMTNIIADHDATWSMTRTKIALAAGEAAPGANVYALSFPQNVTGSGFHSVMTFEDCDFDLGAFDRIAAVSGQVSLLDNTYACKGDFAFCAVAGTRAHNLTIRNAAGGFAVAATYALHLDNWDAAVATDSLTLSGQWDTATDKPVGFANGTPGATHSQTNTRTLVGDALPASSVPGDVFNYRTPTVAYTATAWANTGASWAPV